MFQQHHIICHINKHHLQILSLSNVMGKLSALSLFKCHQSFKTLLAEDDLSVQSAPAEVTCSSLSLTLSLP